MAPTSRDNVFFKLKKRGYRFRKEAGRYVDIKAVPGG
jgi:hypothetical protein